MLEIQNVSKTFNAGTVNQKTALNGLNLKLNEGDFVTVIGGNGAGKSTMLNAVAGVWPVDEGKILIDGVDVTRLSEHQRAAYIGRVFHDMIVVPGDTTAEVLSAVIADEAAIGMVNSKTTEVRLIPAIGKNAGEELNFGGLLGSGPIMPLNTASPAKMISRGGRIPAPLQSLKN